MTRVAAPLFIIFVVGCSSPEGTSTSSSSSGSAVLSSSSSSGGGGNSSTTTASSAAPSSSAFEFPECTPSSSTSRPPPTSGVPSWDCLGHVCFGPPETVNAEITVHAIDYLNSADEADITVTVCAANDDECANPVTSAVTGSDGVAPLTIPLGTESFMGHLQLTNANKIPTIVHLYPPLNRSGQNYTVGVFNPQQLSLVVALAGADELKADRGHVGALVQDCDGVGAPGVAFTLDAEDDSSTHGYLINNIPNTTATETDETGAVGYFNIVPGRTLIHAVRTVGNVPVATVPVLVKAGWVTTTVVPPSPNP